MRIRLASGSFVETAVTLGAAVLMTVAGFAMLQETTTATAQAIATPAAGAEIAVPRKLDAAAPRNTAMPHVDQTAA